MQNSNKILEGSQLGNTIIRQYSTVFNNNSAEAIIKNMTQSSKVPFSAFQPRFNSTSPKNGFGINGFNNYSDNKSIIQKLMQTKQIKNTFEFQKVLENQFVKNPVEIKRIELNETEVKVFRQVINIIDQIHELKHKLSQQTQQFTQLKAEMKQVGLDFPQIQENQQTQINFNNQRLTQEELNSIFDQNQKLQAEIKKNVQQITNNQGSKLIFQLKKNKQQNSVLRRKALELKTLIYSSGDINQKQMIELKNSIQQLRGEVANLQQNKIQLLSQTDSQIIHLKSQNQILRRKTVEILRDKNQNITNKKRQLINYLQSEEANRDNYMRQIQQLKGYYEELVEQNTLLTSSSKGANYSKQYNGKSYDNLNVQSKISPFNSGKENYNSYNYSNSYNQSKNYKNQYSKDSVSRISNNEFEQYEQLLKKMKNQLKK